MPNGASTFFVSSGRSRFSRRIGCGAARDPRFLDFLNAVSLRARKGYSPCLSTSFPFGGPRFVIAPSFLRCANTRARMVSPTIGAWFISVRAPLRKRLPSGIPELERLLARKLASQYSFRKRSRCSTGSQPPKHLPCFLRDHADHAPPHRGRHDHRDHERAAEPRARLF